MRKLLLYIGVVLLCLTTGCEYKDIDRRIFVVAIGIDSGEAEDFKVSLKLAIPQGEVTKIDEKMQIITEESNSISEALRLMKSRVEKELDYVHCKSLIIGEGLAGRDIRHVLDWAVRRRDIQLILNFAVGRPEALDVLKVKPPSERIPSNSLIMAMSGQGTESPFIASVYSYQLMRDVYEQGKDPILPVIEAEGETQFRIDKIALLDKQKVQLVLNPEESRLFNLLTRPDLRTNFPARVDDSEFQYYTESSKSAYKIISSEPGAPVVRYKIKINGIVEENSTQELITHNLLEQISDAGEEALEQSVEALLEKIKKKRLDPFGWGLRYGTRHWNNETEAEEWAALFPVLKLEVAADVRIKYSGLIK
ncbi:Ger(x)C family spore germination protein [Paenibacillus camerounensis]|uniref:Ger(x)C family spore germination protein n=1 Tax=Paenibacillus camerounensis TaxID=1243663 RepID=UPI0005A8C953|nr:Ger(x)C family spore germination protein [Paenibacillus camerounensis]